MQGEQNAPSPRRCSINHLRQYTIFAGITLSSFSLLSKPALFAGDTVCTPCIVLLWLHTSLAPRFGRLSITLDDFSLKLCHDLTLERFKLCV